jgi:hypothetical protein
VRARPCAHACNILKVGMKMNSFLNNEHQIFITYSAVNFIIYFICVLLFTFYVELLGTINTRENYRLRVIKRLKYLGEEILLI